MSRGDAARQSSATARVHGQTSDAREDATGNTDGGLVFPPMRERSFLCFLDLLKALFGCSGRIDPGPFQLGMVHDRPRNNRI